ncbi:MAG: thiamine pyrophosphate-dependent enzyme, partial [Casimicrobiaceae bacterium]
VLDNRGYGCINRLQQAVGGAPFNNLFDDCVQGAQGVPRIDFAAHAASMGALAENVKTIPELEAALQRARAADRTYVVCIETDPAHTTDEGGWWWEVAVPEVSVRAEVRAARGRYVEGKEKQSP